MYYLSLSSVPSQVFKSIISNNVYFLNKWKNRTLLFTGDKKQDPEILSFSQLLTWKFRIGTQNSLYQVLFLLHYVERQILLGILSQRPVSILIFTWSCILCNRVNHSSPPIYQPIETWNTEGLQSLNCLSWTRLLSSLEVAFPLKL